ncbi:MAG TPA: hypothetical protein VJL58_04900 [Pyrinomonadaceae bacterium]|nr:hypothetical protein [Pyrinomonadaceae bacterium]
MARQLRAFVFIGFLTSVLVGMSFGQSVCYLTGENYYYFDGSYSPYWHNTCHGWTSTGSGHVFGAYGKWDQAGRNGIQSYVGGGRRYTHDLDDVNNNMSATGTYWTNFPSPYIDFDDDNGDGRWEEWEVTVEDSGFPVTYREYGVQFWTTWRGSSGATGNVVHTPAISEQLWYTSDKWDTYRYARGLYRHYSRLGNLFDPENNGNKLPSEDIFRGNGDNNDEKQFERRKFAVPLTTEEFSRQMQAAGIKPYGFALEYEVDTEDGPQIVTVGLVPTESELVPSNDLAEVLSSLPETYRVKRLRGVVSYYFESSKIEDRK